MQQTCVLWGGKSERCPTDLPRKQFMTSKMRSCVFSDPGVGLSEILKCTAGAWGWPCQGQPPGERGAPPPTKGSRHARSDARWRPSAENCVAALVAALPWPCHCPTPMAYHTSRPATLIRVDRTTRAVKGPNLTPVKENVTQQVGWCRDLTNPPPGDTRKPGKSAKDLGATGPTNCSDPSPSCSHSRKHMNAACQNQNSRHVRKCAHRPKKSFEVRRLRERSACTGDINPQRQTYLPPPRSQKDKN